MTSNEQNFLTYTAEILITLKFLHPQQQEQQNIFWKY